MSQFEYIGKELSIFQEAINWKNYIKNLLKRYVQEYILEVGAGIGANTMVLGHLPHREWFCLEPDGILFKQLESNIAHEDIKNCSAQNTTIDSLSKDRLFDTILYLDVLEHIQEDQQEVVKSLQHLKVGGHLIILGPAHQWLFTPFDSAIGHYRRYSKSTLRDIIPKDIVTVRLLYLDCVGLLASLANKLFLRQSQPTLRQVKTWDRYMVPISRKFDLLLRYKLGKSVLFIGRKVR
jgi:protein-L-isoaspartate O-methyltransferase